MTVLKEFKSKVMSIEKMKEVLHLRIEEADERMLRVFHAMTEAYAAPSEEEEITDEMIMAIPPSPDWKPMTKAELKAELDEANAEIERGEFLTVDELEKEMQKW